MATAFPGHHAPAAGAVLRDFDVAARHHHEDEAQGLFPALLESMAGSHAVCIRELTAAPCADHRALQGRRHALRQVLKRVVAGTGKPLDEAGVPQFVALHEQHIAREQTELLPMASRLPGAADLSRPAAA